MQVCTGQEWRISLRRVVHNLFRFLAIAPLAGFVCANCSSAPQAEVSSTQREFQSNVQGAQVLQDANAPCVKPAPVVRLEDYDGPLKKTVGFFARALERKAVHPPHYLAGVYLCSLSPGDKFVLFVQDSLNRVVFLDSAFNAGLDQASNRDRAFGQGAEGYAKRFAATTADQASSNFFKDFAFPVMFAEDPRYYRMAHGPFRKRLLHAAGHSFVGYRVDGTRMFNSAEWLGTTSAVVLSNAYHPDNERGAASVATRVGFAVVQDMGFDVLREFWPEVSRKFNLPFRGSRETENAGKTLAIH
jgi:hypothetical protein